MAPTRSPKKRRRTRWTVATKRTPRARKAVESEEREGEEEEREEDEEELWEIEYISEARCRLQEKKFLWEYHVKWLNWAHADDSWERDENFAADRDILQSFWEEIDDLLSRGDEPRGNKEITYAGRRVSPSDRWINERKALAVEATDLRLYRAPDLRAVSPAHGDAPTAAESLWKHGGKDDDDDPDSQSESETALVPYSDEEDDEDYGDSEREQEGHRSKAGRVYASIPDNPRHYYRKEKLLPQESSSGGMDTPRVLGQRARAAQGHPTPGIFLLPNREDGVIRADRKGKLEIHARGPVRARPKPIKLFTAEELLEIRETQYENARALIEGTLLPATDDDGESDVEEQPVDEDQDTPASPLDPHEEYRLLQKEEPLFLAGDNDDNAHNENDCNFVDEADYPPPSSPVPESPPTSPPATPTHDRLAITSFLGPILERTAEAADGMADAFDMAAPDAEFQIDDTAADVFESRPNPLDDATLVPQTMPEVELGELISHEYLDVGGAGLAAIWERGPSADTLASTETMADDAEAAGPGTDGAKPASVIAKDVRNELEDRDAAAMDVDEEDQIEAALDAENNVEAVLEEDCVEAGLIEENRIEGDYVDAESELEEGEIRE